MLSVSGFHDWAITVCFYAAIHFVEARLFYMHFQHTETSVPLNQQGELEYTPHRWREKMVRDNFAMPVWRSFRKLRENSEQARYLSFRQGATSPPNFLSSPATEFFRPEDARKLYDKELKEIKTSLKLDLSEFLHPLEAQNTGSVRAVQANQIIKKLLDKYSSKDEILAQSRRDLSGVLNSQEMQLFLSHLTQIGYRIKDN